VFLLIQAGSGRGFARAQRIHFRPGLCIAKIPILNALVSHDALSGAYHTYKSKGAPYCLHFKKAQENL
jgi:hypothetical protein